MKTEAAKRRLNQSGPRAGRSNARLIEGTDRVWTNITKTHQQPYHHYCSTTTTAAAFHSVIADYRRPCDRAADFDDAAAQRLADAKRSAPFILLLLLLLLCRVRGSMVDKIILMLISSHTLSLPRKLVSNKRRRYNIVYADHLFLRNMC